MRNLLYKIVLSILCTSVITDVSYSQNIFKNVFSSKGKDSEEHVSENIFDLDLEENISTPKIGNNQKPIIQAFQQAQAKKLTEKKITVELMRQGEVIVSTIENDALFAPNDTVLKPSGLTRLKPFLAFLSIPGMYKILLVMHSDDTGSQEYTYSLTEKRVNAIYDWFEKEASIVSDIVPYAMGDSEPLLPNNSRKNRYTNRRLEIYLVPGRYMISQAKAGRLK